MSNANHNRGEIIWRSEFTNVSTCALSPSANQIIVGFKLNPHEEDLLEVYRVGKGPLRVSRIQGNPNADFMKITAVKYLPSSGMGVIYANSEGRIKFIRARQTVNRYLKGYLSLNFRDANK